MITLADAFTALRHAAEAAEEGHYAVASMFATTAGMLARKSEDRRIRRMESSASFEPEVVSACRAFARATRRLARASVRDTKKRTGPKRGVAV